MRQGKQLAYIENINYSKEIDPLSIDSGTMQESLSLTDLPEDLLAEIETWVEEQISLGVKEFIKRLTFRLGQSLHGFCLLRALGYHAQIEAGGKPVKTLRQAAKHFKCSHQFLHRISKDLEAQLNIKTTQSLEIEKKTYSMKVTPPEGYITLGQAIKEFNLKRTNLNNLIKQHGVELKPYKRKSKILKRAELKKILNFENKESI